ncbi:MAG TPA: DUF983 domain-containing protein [Thermoanaerobaculia bacterium]|nr:DUF983 domain-containing protein [Thermoanaerobaculia bacterium]
MIGLGEAGLALRRGLRRRCPRCGEGPLFRRRIEVHERCDRCDLLFQPNAGDTLMFTMITDRVPLLIGVILVYFLGFRSSTWMLTAGFLVALAVPLMATIRERQGLALALVYLSRRTFGDLSE